jgi:hypothetical protein
VIERGVADPCLFDFTRVKIAAFMNFREVNNYRNRRYISLRSLKRLLRFESESANLLAKTTLWKILLDLWCCPNFFRQIAKESIKFSVYLPISLILDKSSQCYQSQRFNLTQLWAKNSSIASVVYRLVHVNNKIKSCVAWIVYWLYRDWKL